MKRINELYIFFIYFTMLIVLLSGCYRATQPITPPPALQVATPTSAKLPTAVIEILPIATKSPTSAPLPTSTVLPTIAPTTEPTAEPTPDNLTIIRQDDFSDPGSGWESYREFDGILDYESGGYRMQVNEPLSLFWVSAAMDLADAVIEIDATKQGGPDDNQFGLMCRLDQNYDYYAFIITGQGNFSIGKVSANSLSLLGSGEMGYSDAILPGQALNHIRAECVGDTLTLIVNGEKLLEVQDSSLLQGDVGMVAGTAEEGGTDILFDNFVVW